MSDMEGAAQSLRIFCVSGDRAGQQSLHEAIISVARAAGLSGASALVGKMGLGQTGQLYSDLLSDTEIDRQPIVVEIIDQADRLAQFLPTLHDLVQGRRLMTLERAEVILYQPRA